MQTSRNEALRLLGRREHSVSELREKLQKKFPKEVEKIEAIITEFIEKDWLSDERFCDVVIKDQIIRRQGPRKIEQKLILKGVEPSLVKDRLMKHYSKDDEYKIAKYLYEKKEKSVCSRKPKISNFEKHQKVSQFLIGRGFGYEVINEVGKD